MVFRAIFFANSHGNRRSGGDVIARQIGNRPVCRYDRVAVISPNELLVYLPAEGGPGTVATLPAVEVWAASVRQPPGTIRTSSGFDVQIERSPTSMRLSESSWLK